VERKAPEKAPDCSPFVSVYNDKTCIGFIINRGRAGFEAYDRDENSLGTFASEKDAADAISHSANETPEPPTTARRVPNGTSRGGRMSTAIANLSPKAMREGP
jgi:hypothetical protein